MGTSPVVLKVGSLWPVSVVPFVVSHGARGLLYPEGIVAIYIFLALIGWVWPHAPDPPNYGLPHP